MKRGSNLNSLNSKCMNQKIFKTLSLIAIVFLASFTAVKLFSTNNIALQKQETLKERVIKAGVIRVGYLATTPQQLAKDPKTGQLYGMFYDVVEEMGKKLNLKI